MLTTRRKQFRPESDADVKPSKGMDAGGASRDPFPRIPEGWLDLWESWDVPRILMNKSRAWIIEEFVPEGQQDLVPRRTRSRFSQWKSDRKLKGAPRPEHWRIIRMSGDDWEDIRRKDRMILEEAMETIRRMAGRWPHKTLRIRNCKSDDVIMGAIVCADIPKRTLSDVAQEAMASSSGAKMAAGVSHSKN